MDSITDMDRREVSPCTRDAKARIRRARIVDAARTLFAENGFHGTGIAQISKGSGVLVGQIYRDFASKEAIVAAIAESDLDEFLNEEALSHACHCADEQVVRDWIARFVASNDNKDLRLITEIMAEASRNDRIAEIFQACHDRIRRQLVVALRMLVPPHVPEERLQRLADLILTLSAGVFQRQLASSGQLPEGVLDSLMDCVDREIDALRTAG